MFLVKDFLLNLKEKQCNIGFPAFKLLVSTVHLL